MTYIYFLALSILLCPYSYAKENQVAASFGHVIDFQHDTKRNGSELEAFNQSIQEAYFVVVDFYATWCGPCAQLAHCINELAKEFSNVKFLKINIDTYKEIATNYSIRSIPQLLFFKNGQLLSNETLRGKQPKNTIKNIIKKHI